MELLDLLKMIPQYYVRCKNFTHNIKDVLKYAAKIDGWSSKPVPFLSHIFKLKR